MLCVVRVLATRRGAARYRTGGRLVRRRRFRAFRNAQTTAPSRAPAGDVPSERQGPRAAARAERAPETRHAPGRRFLLPGARRHWRPRRLPGPHKVPDGFPHHAVQAGRRRVRRVGRQRTVGRRAAHRREQLRVQRRGQRMPRQGPGVADAGQAAHRRGSGRGSPARPAPRLVRAWRRARLGKQQPRLGKQQPRLGKQQPRLGKQQPRLGEQRPARLGRTPAD
jgi:hypothetical protein